MNAKGLVDLNAENSPPKDAELRKITRIDANTVEINDINAAGFKAHVKLALYKGKGQIGNAIIRWWIRSPYNHCEIKESPMKNLIASLFISLAALFAAPALAAMTDAQQQTLAAHTHRIAF